MFMCLNKDIILRTEVHDTKINKITLKNQSFEVSGEKGVIPAKCRRI